MTCVIKSKRSKLNVYFQEELLHTVLPKINKSREKTSEKISNEDFLILKYSEYNKVIRLEVLKSNIRAVKTYESLGFKVYSENDLVYKMHLRG